MLQENAVTLKQLRALAAVIREGSVTAAAAGLNVTPPAVSTQVRLLESFVGAPLMRRRGDGRFEATVIGAEMLRCIAHVEATLEQSYERIRALRAGRAGFVRIAVVSTGKYFAPALLAAMRRALPEIETGLKIGNREETIAALGAREVELAIMGRPPQGMEVESEVLGDHPHVMIAPPDHPLLDAADPIPRLFDETFLAREPGSGTRILMTRYLDRLGEGRPYRAIEMGTNETIKQAVIAGLGLALISAHTVVAEIESGRLKALPLPGLPILRQWLLIRRTGAALTPAAERVRAFMLAQNGGFLPGPG